MLRLIFEKILKGERLSEAERIYFLQWADQAAVLKDASPQSVTVIEQNMTPLQEMVVREVENYIRGKGFITEVSEISNKLGLMQAGEFRVGNDRAPGDGFTGGRFGFPGFTYGGVDYFLVGVSNDVAQIGLSLANGTLYAINANISGTITATAGNIGGWSITSDAIQKLTGNRGISIESSTPRIRIGDLSSNYIVISGEPGFSHIASSNFDSGVAGFMINGVLGDAEFNNITARGELKTFLLTSSNQMAVAGNIIVSKDAGKLGADVSSVATTVNFGKALTVGDWIKIQGPDSAGSNNLEWILIGSLVSGTTYNVTRNVDGSGANGWLKDTPFVVIGHSGDSRIELVAGATGSIQLITQGAAWNTQTVQASMSTVAGAITAGAGNITINSLGITFENGDTNKYLIFKNSTGAIDKMYINSMTDDALSINNIGAGKPIRLYIKDTAAVQRPVTIIEDPSNANVLQLDVNPSTTGGKISIGSSVVIWGKKDGTETVFNEDSYDIDFRVEGAAVSDVFKVNAGLDRAEFGADHYIATRSSSNPNTYFNEANQDMDTIIRTVNQDSTFVMDAGLDKATSFLWDGWGLRDETWTRTGNHTFTVSGDLTSTFRPGTKIRYKDGGSFEYGVVGSSSHAAGTTTVNLIVNTDYAMAAATITDKYISYIEAPEGFPDTFNYSPTVASSGGSITSYTILGATWKVFGKQIKANVDFKITNNGTGSGQINVDVPITIAAAGVGAGREYAIGGKQLQSVCDVSLTIAKLFNYDNTYPGGTNYQLVFSVIFGF